LSSSGIVASGETVTEHPGAVWFSVTYSFCAGGAPRAM
jgi:hypothetical protein